MDADAGVGIDQPEHLLHFLRHAPANIAMAELIAGLHLHGRGARRETAGGGAAFSYDHTGDQRRVGDEILFPRGLQLAVQRGDLLALDHLVHGRIGGRLELRLLFFLEGRNFFLRGGEFEFHFVFAQLGLGGFELGLGDHGILGFQFLDLLLQLFIAGLERFRI